MSRCHFHNNIAFTRSTTTAPFGSGGAIGLASVGSQTENGSDGRGVYVYNTNFHDNTARRGGAIAASQLGSQVYFVNSRFFNNSATSGGAMRIDEVVATIWPRVEFCTMSGNVAQNSNSPIMDHGGGAIHVGSSSPGLRLRSSILWGNNEVVQTVPGGESIAGVGVTSASVSYSNVEAPVGGGLWLDFGNNLNQNPIFVNGGTGNLRLASTSPCLEAANDAIIDTTPTVGIGDVADVDEDMIRAEFLPWDLDDQKREHDLQLPGTPPGQDWAVLGAIADMGCYERTSDG